MTNFDVLGEFDVTALKQDATGQPLELPVNKIDYDPNNIRTERSLDPVKLEELAATIAEDGLIEPISVRNNPHKKGFYLVNCGERRLRAVRMLGHKTIKAFVWDQFDPYVQAVENIQREDIHPLDLARFVEARLAAGDSRTTIAKRLGKAQSYITEIALLTTAPPVVIQALKDDRIDTRTAYVLGRKYQDNPEQVTEWLAGTEPVSRAEITSALAKPSATDPRPAPKTKSVAARSKGSKNYNALAVTVGGQPGTLQLGFGKSATQATIRFGDGSQKNVEFAKITLVSWTRL
jgi:ParB family chromosome partitioning protein